jgi:hypothetical protein
MTEEEETKPISRKHNRHVLLTVLIVLLAMAALSLTICYQVIQAEAYSRYVGIKNLSMEKVARIVRGTEMNANNVFDEVSKTSTTRKT